MNVVDRFIRGILNERRLVVGAAITTQACQRAEAVQSLGATSAVALGRLLTASALLGLIQDQPRSLSLQIVSRGRVKQIFADATAKGELRGYVRPTDLAMPPLTREAQHGRRTLGHGFKSGVLSVIRMSERGGFVQSSTDLWNGEVDEDVEHYLVSSEQVPSLLVADVLLDDHGVRVAGGLVAQASPDASPDSMQSLAKELRTENRFQQELEKQEDDPRSLLRTLFPNVVLSDEMRSLRWHCRCSRSRVIGALRMLEPVDMAEMIEQGEDVAVTCEFCGSSYKVTPDEISAAFSGRIRGEN